MAKRFLLAAACILQACLSFAANMPSRNRLLELGRMQVQSRIRDPAAVAVVPCLGFRGEITAYHVTYASPGGDEYTLLLSNDPGRPPILAHGPAVDSGCRSPDRLLSRAWKSAPGAVPDEVYFLGFGEFWHRFAGLRDTVYINLRPGAGELNAADFRSHLKRLARSRRNEPDASDVQTAWTLFSTCSVLDPSASHYIPHYTRMPNFDWHAGCTPTAASDIFGYYDAVYGYGNLIRYFYKEWDPVETEYDDPVPDCLEGIANRLGTDAHGASDWDQPMAENICEAAGERDPDYEWSDYGYDFAGVWSRIKSEIDGGYPVLLNVAWWDTSLGHSVPVLGYTDANDGFYLYDTWNSGIQWWDRNLFRLQSAVWFHPELASQNHGIELTSQKGCCDRGACDTEILFSLEYNTITWDSDNASGKASIYLNTNNGIGSWEKLVDLDDNPGQWEWLTPTAFEGLQNRIRVRWWNSDRSKVLGEDASCRHFTILSKSIPGLTDGMAVHLEWPASYSCQVGGGQWGAVGIHSDDYKSNTNRLELFS
ncbi:C39 family peptidase, partial [bacterium]|nr:C39 family peptidase [bacterium]